MSKEAVLAMSEARDLLRQETLQRASAAHVPEPTERLFLDLADPFPGDTEQATDLFQRHRLGTVETEIQPKDLGLTLFQGGENLLDRLGEGVLESFGIGTGILGIGEIVQQLVVFPGRERRIEREMVL